MASGSTWTPVVALALADTEGRFLLQQRPLDKHHGGLWEFPGGKVEIGENPRLALCREVLEELGIQVHPGDLQPALLEDEGEAAGIVLFLYTCTRWTGTIDGLEGQQWGWFSRSGIEALLMPPMDRSFADRLVDKGLAKPECPPYVAPSNARP